MEPLTPDFPSTEEDATQFQQAVHRLYWITVYGRWAVVGGLWLTLGLISAWHLRESIALMIDYFTWTTLRYGVIFHPMPAIGLGICLGMTLGLVIWQSRNHLMGLPQREQKRLEKQVCQIHQQGPSHPLWKSLFQS